MEGNQVKEKWIVAGEDIKAGYKIMIAEGGKAYSVVGQCFIDEAKCCFYCRHYEIDYGGDGKCNLHGIEPRWTQTCARYERKETK